jgi:TetR/AcrR family transcriptional regulator
MVQASTDSDVRQRILACATRLFAEQGYAGTPIQAVADAAGVTKPTLVYHFGSKDGLRDEVITLLLAHWRDELPRLMAAATSGGPRLDALLGALFQFFLDDRRRAMLLVREMLDHPESMRQLLRQHLQPWTRLLTEAIRLGQTHGQIRDEVDPEAYTQLFTTAAIGVLAIGDRSSALVTPEPSIDAQLHELVRIARSSLFRPRPAPPEEA